MKYKKRYGKLEKSESNREGVLGDCWEFQSIVVDPLFQSLIFSTSGNP